MRKIDTELKVGDIVCLKHGGPLMTVIRIFERSQSYTAFNSEDKEQYIDAECAWFDGNDLVINRWFPEHCLRVKKGDA